MSKIDQKVPKKTSLTTEDQAKQLADDWQDSVKYPGMKESLSKNLLWCPQHETLGPPGSQSQHWKKYHSMDSVEQGRLILEKLSNITSKANVPDITSFILDKPENLILMDLTNEAAQAGAMLAKDPELRFQYDQLVFQKLIPYDWNYYMWIKKCISYWNKSFGLSCTMNLDESVLSDEQRIWLKKTVQENIKIAEASSKGA